MVETTRRREIEDVASELFREHGYSGTSVRDIARALDIQGASLYAHVASKQDVLWSIVDRTASQFEAAADAALAGLRGDADPMARLRALASPTSASSSRTSGAPACSSTSGARSSPSAEPRRCAAATPTNSGSAT